MTIPDFPTNEDAIEAVAVLEKTLKYDLLHIPPGLAVQLPNIIRCLKAYQPLAPSKKKGTPLS